MTCKVTEGDPDRLATLNDAWRESRAEAIRGGGGAELRKIGAAVDPRINLDRPQPTPGNYQCRTIKLGSAHADMLSFVAYGWFRCRVTLTPGGDLILRKVTGSQRQVGLVCPDTARRARFVGVMQLGDETVVPTYGVDPERDVAGFVQRIGADRWRVVFPSPPLESKLDVLELRRTR